MLTASTLLALTASCGLPERGVGIGMKLDIFTRRCCDERRPLTVLRTRSDDSRAAENYKFDNTAAHEHIVRAPISSSGHAVAPSAFAALV